jgi:putative ABC transport system ATP-binding protein
VGTEIRAVDVEHIYAGSDETAEVQALRGVTLTIAAGSLVALMGASGSGKSTLLHLMGAIERPTRGSIHLGAVNLSTLPEAALTAQRRLSIGFIFQFFHLIPTLSVEENVAFPLRLAGVRRGEVRRRVAGALDRVGLTSRATHYPGQLSGGEMQRAAIGRAIVHRPPLLLADEPTGNLDSRTGASVLELLSEIHRQDQPTIVMATHSTVAAGIADRVIQLVDGRIASEESSG